MSNTPRARLIDGTRGPRLIALCAGMISMFHTPLSAHTFAEVEADLNAEQPTAEFTNVPAPELALEDARGRSVRLDDFHGKVVVLSFGRPGCPDLCVAHAKRLEEVRELGDTIPNFVDSVSFVRVSLGHGNSTEIAGTVRSGVLTGDRPPGWYVLNDTSRPGADAERLERTYASAFSRESAIEPTIGFATYIVDPSGRLRARIHGLDFSPLNVMFYIAALIHGDHAVAMASDVDVPDRDYLPLALGGGFALLGTVGYLLLTRRRRGSERGS